MKTLTTLLLATTLLTGCAGHSYFVDTYNDSPKNEVDVAGLTYVLYDRPDLNKMYVRSSFGSVWHNGARANTYTEDEKDIAIDMKQAGKKYLTSRGKKDCTFEKGKEIMNGQFEFSYKCKS
jgi:hypothetical protein